MSQPFTQWECEMAVWRADASGWPLDNLLWIGSCTNRMEFRQGYAEERAETSGVAWPDVKLLEEEHSMELENLWSMRADENRLVMPGGGITREQRFVAVFLWVDEESGCWHKRTYYNAQFNPFIFGSTSQVFEGKVQMRAGWVFEQSGRLAVERPTLDASAVALVRYVSELENIPLYAYDMTGGGFTAITETSGRATIVPGMDGPHVFSIKFDGVKALAVKAGGQLHVGRITAIGGTFSNTLPRLEFWTGARRVASLASDGELAVPKFGEQASDPVLSEDFEFRNGGSWLASLDRTGAYAPAVEDGLA